MVEITGVVIDKKCPVPGLGLKFWPIPRSEYLFHEEHPHSSCGKPNGKPTIRGWFVSAYGDFGDVLLGIPSERS